MLKISMFINNNYQWICQIFYVGTSLMAQTVKKSAWNTGDLGSIPGLGRSPGVGNGNLLQDSCLENFIDYSPWGQRVRQESDYFSFFLLFYFYSCVHKVLYEVLQRCQTCFYFFNKSRMGLVNSEVFVLCFYEISLLSPMEERKMTCLNGRSCD